ncbi:GAF and ANTAR domain-containing protein [Actinopolymorpha sp. B9G3]|uniref:GAF and ANTAR domain-containing protein n=1 Tax=Actinopolymorpha sp. B9G3 TaxID=3158970 RepID=UPI0032D968C9
MNAEPRAGSAVAATRYARLYRLLADCADRTDGPESGDHVCDACAEVAGADGAALSLISAHRWSALLGTSGELAKTLADLQFTLGQGPKIHALQTGHAVIVEDVASEASAHDWPVFAPAAADLGIRALAALPLSSDGNRVGVLQLYRTTPRLVDPDELHDAAMCAELALVSILGHAGGPEDVGSSLAAVRLGERAEVYQATGMVAEFLGISLDDALARVKFHAFSHEQSIGYVAHEIVAGQFMLEADSPG